MRKAYSFNLLVETGLGIFWTCWVEALLQRGASLQDAAFVAAAWFGGIAIFEVPTGVIADRYGRKASTIIGLSIMGIAFGSMAFSDGTAQVVSGLVAAFGATMISGARDAWMFELFRKEHPGVDTHRFWTVFQLLGRVGMIVGSLGGVWLTTSDPRWPWLATAGLCFLAALLATTVSEPREAPHAAVTPLCPTELQWTRPKIALGLFLLGGAAFGFESGIRNLIYQPFVVDLAGDRVMALGIFQSTLALIRIVSLLGFMRFLVNSRHEVALMLSGPFALALAEVYAVYATSFFAFLAFYAVAVWMLGWHFPLRATSFNRMVDDRSRATWLSIDSMTANLAGACACLLFARSATLGIQDGWVIASASLVFSTLLLAMGASKSTAEKRFVANRSPAASVEAGGVTST